MEDQENMDFVAELAKEFIFELDGSKSDENQIVIRCAIETEQEINRFVAKYGLLTKTCWIINSCGKTLNRWQFSKSWKCQHSNLRKREGSVRNKECKAAITVVTKKVTKDTVKKDKFLQREIKLPTKFTILLKHSHLINVADSLRFMRVPEEMKQQFFGYFDNGCTPTSAKHFHEDMLIATSDNFVEDIANAAKNPTYRQIAFLFQTWRSINLGPVTVPFEKLDEKIKLYEEKGATVVHNLNDTWAVLVVTGVMKRSHKLNCSSEVIFVDSTASCESSGSSLTILLTATKVGAVPIAAMIHENQTTQSYVNAFSLLKREFPLCFGDKEAPAVFMTDDSRAEKNALAEVFPESQLLLCHFHVAQAEWRWIHSCRNIELKQKPFFMKLFQAVMYANNEEELLAAYSALKEAASSIPEYLKRMEKFFLRREEWTTVDRQVLLIRGHNTNNFAEASIRILKDIVLHRTKAYNTVALVDFFVSIWEKYLILKLMEFSNGRRIPLYGKFLKGLNIPFEKCRDLGGNLYEIPSESKEDIKYLVDIKVGMCTCISGRTGAFCKHQSYLQEKLKVLLPNTPVLDEVERHNFAKLALGAKCGPSHFYKTMSSSEESIVAEEEPELPPTPSDSKIQTKELASAEDKERLVEEFRKFLHANDVNKSTLENFTTSVKGIAPQKANISLTRMVYSLREQRRVRKIKVQPTSITRRRAGVTRTNSRIPPGRPSKKRKHNLTENIKENVRPSKKHN